MEIKEIESGYIDKLVELEDPSSQCEYLLNLGMNVQDDLSIRIDENRVEGCKSAIWIKLFPEGEKLYIRMDSDSYIIKGAIQILLDMYNEHTKKEISQHIPHFLAYISDSVIYPDIKRNGLTKCYQKIAHLN